MAATKAYRSKRNAKHVIYEDGDDKIVFSGGSLDWRTNNPGAMQARGGFSSHHGMIGSSSPNAIFPDYQTGKAAMVTRLQTPEFFDASINDAIEDWAQTSPSDVAAYRADVHNWTGLDMKRKVSSRSSSEFENMRAAMERHEGYIQGEVWTMKKVQAAKSKNDKNFTDFKVDGSWISKSAAISLAKQDKLDAVVSGDFLRPSPGQPSFKSIEEEATDEEEGENPKHHDQDDK